jgi:hypothetical protein
MGVSFNLFFLSPASSLSYLSILPEILQLVICPASAVKMSDGEIPLQAGGDEEKKKN